MRHWSKRGVPHADGTHDWQHIHGLHVILIIIYMVQPIRGLGWDKAHGRHGRDSGRRHAGIR